MGNGIGVLPRFAARSKPESFSKGGEIQYLNEITITCTVYSGGGRTLRK
jgi:hypothetical protein